MKKSIVLLLLGIALFAEAKTFKGVVLDDKGEPLVGANVVWLNTTQGTATDADGHFELAGVTSTQLVVASYTGYRTDTVALREKELNTIVLVDEVILDEVTIMERKMSVLRSRTSALDVQTISSDELCKAACCNLSESFETSASVDVAYSDAATGAKQIRLLGLSGTYIQLLNENTPGVRGLGQNFGLEYIPGPWMYSIQVSKGTSSVLNGYEAISGQINVELLKPQLADPLSINAMLNSEWHYELNLTGGWKLNDKVSTGVLAHFQSGSSEMDHNDDDLLDMPKNNQVNLVNRWNIKHGDYTAQIFVRGIYDHRMGGQTTDRILQNERSGVPSYQIDLNTKRIEGFMKNGYLFDEDRGTSIGIIAAASYHRQDNQYGIYRQWDASQTNAYLNGIFQTNIGNDNADPDGNHEHKLSVGVSANYDRYDETANDDKALPLTLERLTNEVTPGIFAEYTYMYKDKITMLLGVREDYSTEYGWFTTPRANLRLAPWQWWTLRGSVGLGYRSPNVIADNAAFLVSNRWLQNIDIADVPQEKALNTGVSTTFYIPVWDGREMQLSAEYYYTKFLEGMVVDWDYSMTELHMREIGDGVSAYGHNWQVEANVEVLRGWTWTLAYRQTDVKNRYDINGVMKTTAKPLTNKFKGIITTSYQTHLRKWQFDLTAQFNGYGRMPLGFHAHNDQYYESGGFVYHKWYPQLLGQITRFFRTCSVYVGGENITNFRQHDPIVGGADPYGNAFDASMVWGPINGWKAYIGFRWALER